MLFANNKVIHAYGRNFEKHKSSDMRIQIVYISTAMENLCHV